MKVFFRRIHLYLSLAAGIVIAIVCFTGAMLVFEKEMQAFIYPERYKVQVRSSKASLETLEQSLQEKVSGASVSSIKFYTDPARTVEVGYSEKKDAPAPGENKAERKKPDNEVRKEGDKKPQGRPGGVNQAFMDPYTGELISLYNYRNTFFFTIFSLHRWLLADATGKFIVGTSTLIFLFIIITGIVLWWPKTKAKLKQHLTLKWGAGWKRINHDLHVVIGFYTSIFLFVFAFTGLAWSFQWFNDAIYKVTGTENVRPEPPRSAVVPGAAMISFTSIAQAATATVPEAIYYTIQKPSDSTGAYTVTIMPKDAAHERASDQYFFDQYNGSLIGTNLFSERNLGQRIRSTFYPIHVGSIAGLPGRIIAFISCIAGFTFPVTGVILWLNRLKKKKKKKAKQRKHEAKNTTTQENTL